MQAPAIHQTGEHSPKKKFKEKIKQKGREWIQRNLTSSSKIE